MASFFSSLFSSTGVKRQLAAILTTIVNVAYLALPLAPQVQPIIDTLNSLIQAFGGIAVAHATTSGTVLSKAQLGTVSSLIGIFLFVVTAFHISVPVAVIAALSKLQVVLAGVVTGQVIAGKPFES